jgi:hypothetical protein
MATVKVNESNLTAIANKIRAKGNTSDDLVFPEGFIEAIDKLSGDIPEGYIKPLGILTDSLITRSSNNNGHKATIPEGYYTESGFTISEWKSGQETGLNSNGSAFTIDGLGFKPRWVVVFINSNTIAANTVMAFFSTGSASRYIYKGSKATISDTYTIVTDINKHATINSDGFSFPAPSSSVKYSNVNYRWYAMR